MTFRIIFEGAAPDISAPSQTGPDGSVDFDISQGQWLIGRAAEADIRFANDKHCSRKALLIEYASGQIFIRPVSDTIKCFIDGQPLRKRTRVMEGQQIRLAQQSMIIAAINSAAAHPPIEKVILAEKTTVFTPADMIASVSSVPNLIEIGTNSTLIGRGGQQNVVALNHSTVSRVHAEVRSRGGRAYIRDRGSANGTFVNGKRLSGATVLSDDDVISIGPFIFRYSNFALHATKYDESGPVLEALGLTVDVKDRKTGKPLRILDNLNLQVNKGEFVCIVGSSGSGKSTLVNLLSGRTQSTSGGVQMKGTGLLANFSALKHQISYVPQNNALHETLTLKQALGFAAKLRLQSDLSKKARDKVVHAAAAAVDLSDRIDLKIDVLSGGQKKRASLASEMLASPEVLFLDEVTSGLDESTDREIMALMRKRADAGMTIVCVTHTLANIHAFCDKLVVMGNGGIPTFIGHPKEALKFFGVETLGDIFDALAEVGPKEWRKRAERSLSGFGKTHGKFDQSAPAVPLPRVNNRSMRTAIIRQLGVLTHRSTLLTLADTKFLLMAFIQSVMIGAMLGYAYSEFGDASEEISSRIALLMALGTSALWLGTNTAASNIVSEAVIFQRERDVNVSTIAFVVSKFLVSGVFSVIQITIVMLIAAQLAEEIPGSFAVQLTFMALGALIGVGVGLSISAFSTTQEQANTIVPLALIPQLILAGVLVPALPEPGVIFSKISISAFWMTEGMTDVYIQFADSTPTQVNLETGRREELEAEPMYLAFIVLLIHLGATVTGAVGLALNRFNRRKSST